MQFSRFGTKLSGNAGIVPGIVQLMDDLGDALPIIAADLLQNLVLEHVVPALGEWRP